MTHRSGWTRGAWANWRPREQRRLKDGWLNWAREQPGFCLGLGPAASPAVPAAELGLAAGTQRSASRATPGADVRGGRRGFEREDESTTALGPGPLNASEYHFTQPGFSRNGAAQPRLCRDPARVGSPQCPQPLPWLQVGAAPWCQQHQAAVNPQPLSNSSS